MLIQCPHCETTNRIQEERLKDGPNCGHCKQPILQGAPISLNDTQFSAFLKHSPLPVVVDFWAPWCGPCRMFAPTFADTAKTYSGKAIFVKINTEAEQALAAQYAIRSIPTLAVFKNGQETTRLSGALPAPQFRQWLAQQGISG